MRILIIEDEEILCKILMDKFISSGWTVSRAKDGEEGVEAIKKEAFDVVLLDLLLPKKDGFQVLQEIRSKPEYKKLPIIVLSNLGSEADVKMAMSLGANDYLIKTKHSLKDIVKKAEEYVKK